MKYSATGNRRQMHRLAPNPVLAPVMSIVAAGRRLATEKVVDINLGGARVELSAHNAPALRQGQEVTASIQAPGLDGCAEIRGRVVFSSAHDGRNVVGIAFTETLDQGQGVPADFFSLFNRRADQRAAGRIGGNRMAAVLLNAAGVADAVIDLTVVEHSDNGLGFTVDPHTDAFIQDCDATTLTLPDHRAATGPATMCRRELRQNEVYYGCTFGRD